MVNAKDKFMQNKKGDIPVVVLVIEVILICILTILSFAYFNLNFNENFLGIGLAETMKSVSEEGFFVQQTGFTTEYGTLFTKDGLKIEIKANEIEGVYVTKGLPFIGKEKVAVRITSPRQ